MSIVRAPRTFAYESMGTGWEIGMWDDISDTAFADIQSEIIRRSQAFDSTFSRFIPDSLVCHIAQSAGTYEVPEDMTAMLRLYRDLYEPSQRKLNPLIGFSISDLGYDAQYSLHKKDIVRPTPDFTQTLRIIDTTHIETSEPVLIDLGALGKGYFVDRLADYLLGLGINKFLVNGSGDIRYHGPDPIMAGLEHPTDKTKIIGALPIMSGALCASGTDRRQWEGRNHVIDPITLDSPRDIIATWVRSETAALCDALATCLFFCDPMNFANRHFEYLILNADMRVKHSPGFAAELY